MANNNDNKKRIGEYLMNRNKDKTPEKMWDNKAAELTGDYAHEGETWKYAKPVSQMKNDIAADEKYGNEEKPSVDNEQKTSTIGSEDAAPKDTPDMTEKDKKDAEATSSWNLLKHGHYPDGEEFKFYSNPEKEKSDEERKVGELTHGETRFVSQRDWEARKGKWKSALNME